MRDYEHPDQIGAENSLADYVAALVGVFREVRRVLRREGTLWLQMGDCYTSGGRKCRAKDNNYGGCAMASRPPNPRGLKDKDLVGLPWLVAFALRADGWYLRQDFVWQKPNAHPESAKDRAVRSHEYLFLLSKRRHYFFDAERIREPALDGTTRAGRSVWSFATGTNRRLGGGPAATMPPGLVAKCLDATARADVPVLDPFFGTGTTGVVCQRRGLPFVGVELNPDYAAVARRRLAWPEPTAAKPLERVA